MAKQIEIECPFCGKDDIRLGLALCAQCQAEIEYRIREARLSEDDMRELEARYTKMEEKLKPPTNLLGLLFVKATLATHAKMEEDAQAFEIAAAARYAAELKRLEANGYKEIVVFQRGGRVIEKHVDLPPNGESVPALYRVELTDLGANKVAVTQLISKTFKVGVREAIKLAEAVPLLLIETASEGDAEKMKSYFEKAGGACNISAT